MSLEQWLNGRSVAGSRWLPPFSKLVDEAAKRDLCIGKRDRYVPCDVLDGLTLRNEHVMGFFLYYYCPLSRPCRVLDPTCGRENYQFKSLKPRMLSEGVEYFDGDIMPWGSFQADVFHLPFRNNFFDIVVYDPPYLTAERRYDDRAGDYGMPLNITPKDVKQYYTRPVLEELARVTTWGGVVIVKGADFYWPSTSNNLFLLIPDILDPREIPQSLVLEARYAYRYYRQNVFRLQRARLKGLHRPLITMTWYLILRKKR